MTFRKTKNSNTQKIATLLGLSMIILMSVGIGPVSMNGNLAFADSNNSMTKTTHQTKIVEKPLPPGATIVTPKTGTVTPLTGPTDSLQVRIGYNYPCGSSVCSRIVEDWTALPYQTLTSVSGITLEGDTWIQPFYELRAGYTGYYSGNRLTDVNDPSGNNLYSNSGSWLFTEGQILQPGHQDLDKVYDNGNVPSGSLIFMDFYFSGYTPF